MAIKRLWHGWTTPENADKYQDLLLNEVIPGIESLEIPGFRSIEVFRSEEDDEVEFVTIMTFDSIQDVKEFQGEDYSRSHVPDVARRVLKRWDERAVHYEAIDHIWYD